MAFCRQCGSKLADGSKFCEKCGCPVLRQTDKHSGSGERQQEYVGKIYKCPNCGEVLKSFTRNCPACGFELRGVKPASAVKEFSLKLEAIESRREYEPPKGFYKLAAANEQISKTDEQKINLIKSFAVPNTAEDMLEFMILATANVNVKVYDGFFSPSASKGEKAINNAWISKINQVYEKAKISHGEERVFQEVISLYNEFTQKVQKQKRKDMIPHIVLLGWLPALMIILCVLMIILWLWMIIGGPGAQRKEIARLEAIEQVAIGAIENGEYKKALLHAEDLQFDPHPRYKDFNELKRQWDIKRELLIDKILEEAAAHGVDLEYEPPPDESEEPDSGRESSSSGGFVSSFVQGYSEAAQPGIDIAKERIEEFNRIVKGETQ